MMNSIIASSSLAVVFAGGLEPKFEFPVQDFAFLDTVGEVESGLFFSNDGDWKDYVRPFSVDVSSFNSYVLMGSDSELFSDFSLEDRTGDLLEFEGDNGFIFWGNDAEARLGSFDFSTLGDAQVALLDADADGGSEINDWDADITVLEIPSPFNDDDFDVVDSYQGSGGEYGYTANWLDVLEFEMPFGGDDFDAVLLDTGYDYEIETTDGGVYDFLDIDVAEVDDDFGEFNLLDFDVRQAIENTGDYREVTAQVLDLDRDFPEDQTFLDLTAQDNEDFTGVYLGTDPSGELEFEYEGLENPVVPKFDTPIWLQEEAYLEFGETDGQFGVPLPGWPGSLAKWRYVVPEIADAQVFSP